MPYASRISGSRGYYKTKRRARAATSIQRAYRRYRRKRANKTALTIVPKSASRSNQLVTRAQVQTMINADKDPEYLKRAIGTFSTVTNDQQQQMRLILPNTYSTIYTKFKIFRFEFAEDGDTVPNGYDSSGAFGNKRTASIQLKKIAFYLKVKRSKTHDCLLKYAVIRIKGSNSGDYANFLTELEHTRIITQPGSYITANQQRAKQDKLSYKQMFDVMKEKTILVKAASPNATDATDDPNSCISINWSHKFGKNGKRVKFSEGGSIIGDCGQYLVCLIATKADNNIIPASSSAAALPTCGMTTIYWENIEDSSYDP